MKVPTVFENYSGMISPLVCHNQGM